MLTILRPNIKSSQIYLYSAFHNTDCIKAASQYQSRQHNSVCKLNIPNWASQRQHIWEMRL